MRRIALWSTATVLAALGLASCYTDPAQNHVTLKVAVADSLAPVMRELAQAYNRRQPWVSIELHEGNTARLEQDLKDGAAYDLYIPSQPSSIEALSRTDAINPRSIILLAFNQLLVVSTSDTDLALNFGEIANPEVRQIAVAKPDLLLGHLTREALTSLRLLPSHDATPLGQPAPVATTASSSNLPASLTSLAVPDQTPNLEPKLLVVSSEEEVLAAVKDGRAQVGITYNTYAVKDPKIRILGRLPVDTYERIAYLVAIPRNAPHNDEAWQFLDYLRSTEAHAIMQNDGLQFN